MRSQDLKGRPDIATALGNDSISWFNHRVDCNVAFQIELNRNEPMQGILPVQVKLTHRPIYDSLVLSVGSGRSTQHLDSPSTRFETVRPRRSHLYRARV